MKQNKILILPGDGIGHEICAVATDVIEAIAQLENIDISINHAAIGGTSYDQHGTPLTDEVLATALQSDAVLLGAVGGKQWESLDISVRPEKGLLRLRKEMDLFANLRPAILHKPLADASSLKPELVADLVERPNSDRLAVRPSSLLHKSHRTLLSKEGEEGLT